MEEVNAGDTHFEILGLQMILKTMKLSKIPHETV